MELVEVWPILGIELRTPRLVLRPVRDEDLGDLVEAAASGIHDPSVMPFGVPWTDLAPEPFRRNLAQYAWRLRADARPGTWTVLFAVRQDGRLLGVQDVRAEDLGVRRTVSTGSWLRRDAQGAGVGVEMRAAVLLWAFDHLGAEVAESSALDWNLASQGVSRRLGYADDGWERVVTRPGVLGELLRFRLTKERFRRPDWRLEVGGLEPALKDLLEDRLDDPPPVPGSTP